MTDALFVRPTTCSYYFGDYYDVSYRDSGFTSCVVYSRTNYDSIIVYQNYEHRDEPNWINIQINLSNDRFAGRAPVPPRTLIQQTTIVQNNTIVNNTTNITNNTSTNISNNTNNVAVNRTVMKTAGLAPASQVMAAKGVQAVKLDPAARVAAQQHSVAVQQVALQRSKNEVAAPGGAPKQPRVASINVPPAHPVAPKSTAAAAPNANRPGVAAPSVSRPVSSAPPIKPSTTPTLTTPSKAPTEPPYTTQTPKPSPSVNPLSPSTSPLTNRLSPPPPPGSPLSKPSTTLAPTRPAPPPPAKGPPPRDKDKDKDKDKDQH